MMDGFTVRGSHKHTRRQSEEPIAIISHVAVGSACTSTVWRANSMIKPI